MYKNRRENFRQLRERLKKIGTHYWELPLCLKSIICNGCGPKAWFIPVPEFCFTASCDHHDYKYFLGGTAEDRLKADIEFYKAMKNDANTHSPFWLRRRYLVWAWIFFVAVRLFGSPAFWYDED